MSLGERVREIRQAKKITYRELAKSAKVPLSTLHLLESGRQATVTTATLQRLAEALGVKPAALLK